MKNKLYALTMMIVILISLAACGGIGDGGEIDLDGTSWELFAYRKTSPIESAKPTLRFEGGQVSGNASCNSYGGDYQVKGDQITFGALFMTEMFCTDPEGIMDQESIYLQMLGSAERFELSSSQLVLFMPDGETLTFVPVK